MAWTAPQFSNSDVNSAGKTFLDRNISPEDREKALSVINNFRSSHGFPLNTFRVGLQRRAKELDTNALVAQRIKRLPSITEKLLRFPTMTLSQMQDLGGCRAIMGSVSQVRSLVEEYKKSDIKHGLIGVDDYITSPKTSGYRSVHLKYRYFSDKKNTYNGQKIEIQLRSQYQHAWATTVETVGTFVKQALKSSQGEEGWLRFFALMSTAVASFENETLVPNTPNSQKTLVKELRNYAKLLDVKNRLTSYGAALQTIKESEKDARFYLLKLEPLANKVTITGFKSNELEKASREYLKIEQQIAGEPGAETVLVSVESVSLLERAYPNYFLDTKVFIDLLDRALAL